MYIDMVASQAQWNTLPITHWVHSWEYGEIQKKNNRTVNRIILRDASSKVVGYFLIISYVLFGHKKISYIPYGPVWLSQPSKQNKKELIAWLRDYGKETNSIAVRLESQTTYCGTHAVPLFAYRTSFHQARGEAILKLQNKSWGFLYAQFSKSTRRNIKKAEKNELDCFVFSGSEIMTQLKNYIALNEENTTAHKTTTHTQDYFFNLFTILSKNSNNFVVCVEKKGVPLAISVYTVFNNKSYCPFGASSREGKRLGAYYLSKTQAVKHMLKLGIQEFNWGGVSIGKNDNNLHGLNSFKYGWGTQTRAHEDFYDLILSPWHLLYMGYNFLKRLR